MSNELWRTTLNTLRSQFESGAQRHHGVRCVLIHAGPGQRDRLRETPRAAPKGRLVEGGSAAYRLASTPEQCTWRRHYYIGEPAGAYLFGSLADDAGRALLGESSAAFEAFPTETLSARMDRGRWLWTLFDFAWQRRAGSPLRAAKWIWDREHMGITAFPYDTAQLRGLIKTSGGCIDIIRGWAERLPDYFFSEVRNVFMASVYTIDILLSELEPSQPNKPAWRRICIHKQPSGDDVVELDAREYRVRGSSADFLELLQAKQGASVLADTLRKQLGQRANRIYECLPPPLQTVIDKPGKGGTGYRML